jgi:hypothetical protein
LIAIDVAQSQRKDNTTIFLAHNGDHSLKKHRTLLEEFTRASTKTRVPHMGEIKISRVESKISNKIVFIHHKMYQSSINDAYSSTQHVLHDPLHNTFCMTHFHNTYCIIKPTKHVMHNT